ncbi:MAG: FHA domain-containing protein [bacterium]|nr:FHA domain-containing protein [bacterium]
MSSRTTEDGIYIYIKGVNDIMSGTTVQVGTTLCEDIQVAEITSAGMPIRTCILLDNSLSVSRRWGDQAKILIGELIDGHAEGEEFQIVTFADGFNVVADFSTEYDSLKSAMGEIAFYNQSSYLTDILYDLLSQEYRSGGANYTRLIIITDGADDNDIKYTQTELLNLMSDSGVVIHAVGIRAENNNALLENLFAYARMTGGVYAAVDRNVSEDEVRSMIDEDYSLFCLRLSPDAGMMDGSKKEARLTLNTSGGTIVLNASLQMPFANVGSAPPEQEENEEAEEEPAAPPETVTEKPEMPSIEVQTQAQEEPKENKKLGIVLLAVGGSLVLALAVVVAILLILKNKGRKQSDTADENYHADQIQNRWSQTRGGEQTVLLQPDGKNLGNKEGKEDSAGDKTVYLLGGNGQSAVRQAYITLTDISNPYRSYRAPIDTRIVIGRKTGDILLGHDATVSHTHCEIIKKGNLFYVKDLKSSNGTFYGNSRVYADTPIISGGILAVGEGKYKITIED